MARPPVRRPPGWIGSRLARRASGGRGPARCVARQPAAPCAGRGGPDLRRTPFRRGRTARRRPIHHQWTPPPQASSQRAPPPWTSPLRAARRRAPERAAPDRPATGRRSTTEGSVSARRRSRPAAGRRRVVDSERAPPRRVTGMRSSPQGLHRPAAASVAESTRRPSRRARPPMGSAVRRAAVPPLRRRPVAAPDYATTGARRRASASPATDRFPGGRPHVARGRARHPTAHAAPGGRAAERRGRPASSAPLSRAASWLLLRLLLRSRLLSRRTPFVGASAGRRRRAAGNPASSARPDPRSAPVAQRPTGSHHAGRAVSGRRWPAPRPRHA